MKRILLAGIIFFICIFLHSCRQGRNKLDVDSLSDMVLVDGGEFLMGDFNETGTETERPAHRIKISTFYLHKFEVTVNDFKRFVEETGYKTDAEKRDSSLAFYNGKWTVVKGVNWRFDATGTLRPGADYYHPVIHVSWNDANEYCLWLSKKMGKKYRLPTEAEWEFAARNRGEEITYSWGNSEPNGMNGGNVADNTLRQISPDASCWLKYTDGFAFTAPVGSFNPNKLGLHDMTGNVWEWCSDWFDAEYYSKSPEENPAGPATGTDKSFRGGCWFSDDEYSRIIFHNFGNYTDQSYGDFGFRIALTP